MPCTDVYRGLLALNNEEGHIGENAKRGAGTQKKWMVAFTMLHGFNIVAGTEGLLAKLDGS